MPEEKSSAFNQGYNYLGPRLKNPYPKDTQEFNDWLLGWQTRFHGEDP